MLLGKRPDFHAYTAGYLTKHITRFDHLAAQRANRDKYPVPLATIVNSFQSWESTDARDMVFAFLDLIAESRADHLRRIQADYSPSVSVTEVYFRACHAYLLDPRARPHRVLDPLRQMLRLQSEDILSEIINLVDLTDLWCEVEWITGKLPEVDTKLNESKPGAAYLECHQVDFARLVKKLDELKREAPNHSENP
ncbi:hypothetical protein A1O3_09167 [Capronia epimyces CBS 606.96]|uniref:Uncharacterized protein n=1 Tax=Capronia epimyces CBS 606.96 TaxID=1182542 RepID=W9XCT7_9EURO|nr:uncharacterized protein A1O3_09167 [Capronia epimyces CBS 606.96]EXJ78008.1 hypothetical protein A1O3_09167 [Capronia epimyces CBS 606.96]